MPRPSSLALALFLLPSCGTVDNEPTDAPPGADAGEVSGDAGAGIPTIPVLRTPMRNAYIGSIHERGSLRPSFSWQPSTVDSDAVLIYEVELGADPSFMLGVTRAAVLTATYTPEVDLAVRATPPVGARLYWRVRACAGDERCSAYSPASWVNVGRSDRDVNGDGFADVIIGAPFFALNQPTDNGGRAHVFFGGAGAFENSSDGSMGSGAAVGDQFGRAAASAGDVNGDGFADIVVGAFADDTLGPGAGRAFVYLGGPTASFDSTPDGTLSGTPGSALGFSVASAGDVNGDGFDDVVVGAPSAAIGDALDIGRALVYLGGAGTRFDSEPDATLSGAAAGDTFGVAVSSAGDVNGDGFDDLLVGAFQNDDAGEDAGSAYLYFGAADGLDSVADATLTGAAAGDVYGRAVAAAGDVNGDGFADVLVGAEANDAGGVSAGRAYLYLGAAGTAFDTTSDGTLTGVTANDRFGTAVASAGDVNGDGLDDVIVGASFNDAAGNSAGRAYVFLGGRGATFDATFDQALTGAAASDFFGDAVAGAGDVNGDGFDDIIVGAFGNDAGGNEAGRAYIYMGRSDGLDATVDATIPGSLAGAAFGKCVGN
jgi:hypothetical protein